MYACVYVCQLVHRILERGFPVGWRRLISERGFPVGWRRLISEVPLYSDVKTRFSCFSFGKLNIYGFPPSRPQTTSPWSQILSLELDQQPSAVAETPHLPKASGRECPPQTPPLPPSTPPPYPPHHERGVADARAPGCSRQHQHCRRRHPTKVKVRCYSDGMPVRKTEVVQPFSKWKIFLIFFMFHLFFDSCSIDSEPAVVSGNMSTLAVAPGNQHPALARTRSPTIRRSTDEHGIVIRT